MSHFHFQLDKILTEMPAKHSKAAGNRLIEESSEVQGVFRDYIGVRYKITKFNSGYQAYYSQHDDHEFELKLEDVPYTPHLGLGNNKSQTSAALIKNVRSEMKNLYAIMNKPELLDELSAQIQNTMQHVQILAEYLEITVSKLSTYEPKNEIVTTIIRNLRDTSQQALQIAESFQEAEGRSQLFKSRPESFEGSYSYKELLNLLSTLLPRIHHQVNSIYGEVNENHVFTSGVTGDRSGDAHKEYATLTATIGITCEKEDWGDSEHQGNVDLCAFNSVSIYDYNIQEIPNPTDTEMLSMLMSIMGDRSMINYIESVMDRQW